MLLASNAARVLSIALILEADDHGRGRANETLMVSRIFPGVSPESRESYRESREAFRELVLMGYIKAYTVRGQSYFEIANWTKHQKVDKPGKPRVPEPCESDGGSFENIPETLANVPETLATDHDHIPTTNDPDMDLDRERSPRSKRAHQLPTDWHPDDAHASLASSLNTNLVLEADKFRDHYAATGKAMKDWNASFRNWLRNSAKFSGGGGKSSNQPGVSVEDLWRMSEEQS